MVNQKSAVLTTGSEKTARGPINDLDAIALGIEARYDLLSGYSIAVTETTIQAARKLGIPERTIQQWKVTRSTLYTQKYYMEFTSPLTKPSDPVVMGREVYGGAT